MENVSWQYRLADYGGWDYVRLIYEMSYMSVDETKNIIAGSVAPNDEGDTEVKSTGGPLALLLPVDIRVWNEARRLVGDKEIRIDALALCASQDPVIVIELLKTANAMFFSGGRSPITSVKTSIVRLGSDIVQQLLDGLKERPVTKDERVFHWQEIHRSRCKRTAIVARILAEALAKNLNDDCQAAGLLFNVGELLAVAFFQETYAKLADNSQRASVNFRLLQDHKFDVEKMGVSYLKRQGIPDNLLFAIDRDGRPRQAERAIMKPLCLASVEFVDAFDTNKWEKLAPGKTLNPKSALRLLQFSDSQYLKVYERCSEYLFSARLLEERQRAAAAGKNLVFEDSTPQVVQTSEAEVAPEKDSELENEIRSLIHGDAEFEDEISISDSRPENSAPLSKVVATEPQNKSTQVKQLPDIIADATDNFSLNSTKTQKKQVARVQSKVIKVTPPKLHTSKGTKTVTKITEMFDQAASSEELLSNLLQMLVDQGPFEKSALIVVSKNRTEALVVAARGPGIGNGQKIPLDDPLSPLAHCFSKLQSFGNRESKDSPWGSKSFALSPIDADHDTPVALYADCGENGALTFEARRVFRTVVQILNEKLPHIPGGIPVELTT